MLTPVYYLSFVFASPGPILFKLGPLTVRWYGFLIAIAVVLGLLLSQRLAKYRNVAPERMSDLLIWLVIGAVPFARLYYLLFTWGAEPQHHINPLAIWQGGLAVHGAILGGTLATILFARYHKISFWQLGDLVAPSLILGQAIGRWGCFFNNEAFGGPTNLPWKLFIPEAYRPEALKAFNYFHPTFLYESLWNFIVFGLILILFFRFPQAKQGTLLLVYAIAYSLGRFWIEGLRIDSLMLGPFRMAQVVSLSLIVLGGVGLWWLYGLGKPLPEVSKTLVNRKNVSKTQ